MVKDLNILVSLCKRRGYVFPCGEIYGGLKACWDYGPLGVQLKRNVQTCWWKEMTTRRSDVLGLDTAILMPAKVWEASGHTTEFSDPLVDCKKCRFRFRLEISKPSSSLSDSNLSDQKCPQCGSSHLTEPRPFNLMFRTQAGALEESSDQIYLRPETAQGIYLNFLNVASTMRKKIPFGIAQIGKAFRNEITVGNFIFRCREFEQMEMQYFVPKNKAQNFFEYWREQRKQSLIKMGLPKESIREHSHSADELAHYAHQAVDLQFLFPMGWKELEGIHNRGDFDLKQHQKFSGKKLSFTDPENNTSYIPWVIETSIGLDRLILAMLCSAYKEETVKGEARVVLSLHPQFSPIQVAILPLSQKKEEIQKVAQTLAESLRKNWRVEYDSKGSIGKRYRRQDEIGTPLCVTVDFESLKDQQVTCRHRDTMKQDRLPFSAVERYLTDKSSHF